jgi:hypothetical protein
MAMMPADYEADRGAEDAERRSRNAIEVEFRASFHYHGTARWAKLISLLDALTEEMTRASSLSAAGAFTDECVKPSRQMVPSAAGRPASAAALLRNHHNHRTGRPTVRLLPAAAVRGTEPYARLRRSHWDDVWLAVWPNDEAQRDRIASVASESAATFNTATADDHSYDAPPRATIFTSQGIGLKPLRGAWLAGASTSPSKSLATSSVAVAADGPATAGDGIGSVALRTSTTSREIILFLTALSDAWAIGMCVAVTTGDRPRTPRQLHVEQSIVTDGSSGTRVSSSAQPRIATYSLGRVVDEERVRRRELLERIFTDRETLRLNFLEMFLESTQRREVSWLEHQTRASLHTEACASRASADFEVSSIRARTDEAVERSSLIMEERASWRDILRLFHAGPNKTEWDLRRAQDVLEQAERDRRCALRVTLETAAREERVQLNNDAFLERAMRQRDALALRKMYVRRRVSLEQDETDQRRVVETTIFREFQEFHRALACEEEAAARGNGGVQRQWILESEALLRAVTHHLQLISRRAVHRSHAQQLHVSRALDVAQTKSIQLAHAAWEQKEAEYFESRETLSVARMYMASSPGGRRGSMMAATRDDHDSQRALSSAKDTGVTQGGAMVNCVVDLSALQAAEMKLSRLRNELVARR